MKLEEFLDGRSVGLYLALVFSAMSLLLTMVLVEVIGRAFTRELKSNIGFGLTELAMQMTDKLDRSMAARYREVSLTARRITPAELNANAAASRKNLETMQKTTPYYRWIGITDLNGKILVAANGLLEGDDMSHRPWFRNALNGNHVSTVHEALSPATALGSMADEPVRFVVVNSDSCAWQALRPRLREPAKSRGRRDRRQATRRVSCRCWKSRSSRRRRACGHGRRRSAARRRWKGTGFIPMTTGVRSRSDPRPGTA